MLKYLDTVVFLFVFRERRGPAGPREGEVSAGYHFYYYYYYCYYYYYLLLLLIIIVITITTIATTIIVIASKFRGPPRCTIFPPGGAVSRDFDIRICYMTT